MAEGADVPAVREWEPDGATLRRARRDVVLAAAGSLVVYGALLIRSGAGPVEVGVLLAAAAFFFVAAVRLREREPTARGAAPPRPAVSTDPRRVPLPSRLDYPVQCRGTILRAAASLLLVIAALATHPDGPSVGYLGAAVGAMGLVNVDLPWLWHVSRIGRRPLTRTTVTVHAVGRPNRWRVVLASDTVAWSTLRVGVLHDVVVGDVLVADLGRHEFPAILTFAGRRSFGPSLVRLTPDRFRTLTGTDLGATPVSPPS